MAAMLEGNITSTDFNTANNYICLKVNLPSNKGIYIKHSIVVDLAKQFIPNPSVKGQFRCRTFQVPNLMQICSNKELRLI